MTFVHEEKITIPDDNLDNICNLVIHGQDMKDAITSYVKRAIPHHDQDLAKEFLYNYGSKICKEISRRIDQFSDAPVIDVDPDNHVVKDYPEMSRDDQVKLSICYQLTSQEKCEKSEKCNQCKYFVKCNH